MKLRISRNQGRLWNNLSALANFSLAFWDARDKEIVQNQRVFLNKQRMMDNTLKMQERKIRIAEAKQRMALRQKRIEYLQAQIQENKGAGATVLACVRCETLYADGLDRTHCDQCHAPLERIARPF